MGKHYFDKKSIKNDTEIIYNKKDPKITKIFSIIGTLFLSVMIFIFIYIIILLF